MDTITVTLPDGTKRTYPAGVTGAAIAESIGPRLAREALAMSVDGETRDLARALTADATVKILTWAEEEGKHAYCPFFS